MQDLDEALQPLYKDRIPVVIKNTNRPNDKGTYIYMTVKSIQNVISGISCDKGFTVILKNMNRLVGFTKDSWRFRRILYITCLLVLIT